MFRNSLFGNLRIAYIVVTALVFLVVFSLLFITISNDSQVSVIKDCKVIDLQQQQIISGTDKYLDTEIRYIVITDKETFICENSILNSKYNNSDLFWRLKKDSTYTFKVAGRGKSFLYDYRNILQIIQ